MKKITLCVLATLFASSLSAQKTIVVNGGQFGNPNENVNVVVYDAASQSTTVIDTIHTQSVQDVLIDRNVAFVAAQDSIVKYNLITQKRMAAAKFAGLSTKTLVLAPNNELIVSNWYGRTSYNVYIYNQTTLALVDSINIPSGVTSMLVDSINDLLVVNQNQSTGAPNYQDTLGSIIACSISSRSVIAPLTVQNYTGDVGELVAKPAGNGAYAFNSESNTVIDVNTSNLPFVTTRVINTNNDLKVNSRSKHAIHRDTIFLKMNQGIGSFNLNTANFIDSLIVDTLVTAFTYDTLNRKFFVNATDFSSFKIGKIYNRNGMYAASYNVGFSPEVIDMYYNNITGILEDKKTQQANFTFYPNPATTRLNISTNPTNSSIFIHDLNGKLMKVENLFNSFNSIDVSQLTPGIYLISIKTDQHFETQRLLIQ